MILERGNKHSPTIAQLTAISKIPDCGTWGVHRQSPVVPLVEIEVEVWGDHSSQSLQYGELERRELHTEFRKLAEGLFPSVAESPSVPV